MFKKYAFISYNHKDVKIAKWLQKKLESYKLPTGIQNEFQSTRYLRPIFRDRSDLNTGILSEELHNNLNSSKYLIVICSPNSAASGWVSEEVRTFIEWGRLEYIIPFIIGGTPNSGDENECFPYALCEYTKTFPEKELLGVDIREDSKEKAFIRVVSRILGLTFDDLWKRHKRETLKNRLIQTISSVVILFAFYWFAVPVSLKIHIEDEIHNLPIPNEIQIQVGDTDYIIHEIDSVLDIKDIPGIMRGREIPVKFSAIYYDSINTKSNLNLGINNKINLKVKRDDSFALFSGSIYNEDGDLLDGVEVKIFLLLNIL